MAAAGAIGLSTLGMSGCFRAGAQQLGRLAEAELALGSRAATPAAFANASATLELPTTLPAQGNSLHPSIIDFLMEHGMRSWAGYRYWIAWSPYLDFRTEMPTIAASNDLVTWVTPLGLPNPITLSIANGMGADVRLNDPEICYDPVADCINLYHGAYNGGSLAFDPRRDAQLGGGLFCCRIFADGTIRGRLIEDGPPLTGCVIPGLAGGSVTVHRDDRGTWHMWHAGIAYRTSKDGRRWSSARPCTVGTPDKPGSMQLPGYMRGWNLNHIGGKFHHADGRMEFAVACVPPERLGGQHEHLAMLACDLRDPTSLYVMLDRWLLAPGEEGRDWDGGSLYRSVLMPHTAGGNRRRLVYSAFSAPCTEAYAMPNRISAIVSADIGAYLVAQELPSG